MEAESLTLTNEDDETIACLLNEAYSHDAIIVVHGFKGSKDAPGFAQAARSFAEKGFSVVRFDMRGCGDSDLDFEEQSLSTQIADLKTVYAFAQDRFDNVALLGASMGALIILLAQLPACSYIFWAPAIRLKELAEEHYDIDWEEALKREVTALPHPTSDESVAVGRAFIEEIHALDWGTPVNETEAPTLIVHGTQDEAVSHEQSIDLIDQFSCRRELVLIYGNHVLNPNLDRAIDETLNWINEWCGEAS